MLILALIAILFGLPAGAQTKSLHPTVRAIVDEISEERIAASMKKLASFGTRDSNSTTEDPGRGIGAARQWIFDEFQSYSPRLQVRFDPHSATKSSRVVRDLAIVNVVAVLPGTDLASTHVAAGAHYDSWCAVMKNGTLDADATAAAPSAPGVDDNASGVAAVLELARVMSRHEFRKSVVFIAFAGEEQGLLGSRGLAKKWKEDAQSLEALLNNDTIGSMQSGNGFVSTHAVRVFSDEPMDSNSRSLARYVKEIGERYLPEMRVDLIFRRDRFGRGGDHTPFHSEGFAAVRMTTPAENLSVQHSPDDTFEHSSSALTSRVARINASVLASLALAPKAPVLKPLARGQLGAASGERSDAVLRWQPALDEQVSSYSVLIRSTLSPFWEREIDAGNVNEFTLKNFSIDDVVIGVKAHGANGTGSLVSAYQAAPFRIP